MRRSSDGSDTLAVVLPSSCDAVTPITGDSTLKVLLLCRRTKMLAGEMMDPSSSDVDGI